MQVEKPVAEKKDMMKRAFDKAEELVKSENEKQFWLGEYYDKKFPYKLLFSWFTFNLKEYHYNRREISYIVKENLEEYVIRNKGYKSVSEFERDVRQLKPLRIDVGAVYNTDVSNNRDRTVKGQPVLREYVIDIDMSDYNSIRTCC